MPTFSPSIAAFTFASEVSNIGIPAPVAIRAASIFVTIPPLPTFEPAPPISKEEIEFKSLTSEMTFAEGCEGGAS